jgi:precorrin-6B methylase 2
MRPAAAILPAQVLQRIDRMRTRRFLAKVGPPTEEYVRRHGLAVVGGPLRGMRYLDDLERASGDLVAKLLGTYERELHPVFEEWIAARYEHIVDVGCAEGYYAVGLACASPATTVHAYDIDPHAREQCAALARLNGVAERVLIGGACEPATLEDYPERGVALLSDCEGYERVLLDPVAAPRLTAWPILVELHEFIDPEIAAALRERFADTHVIQIIEGEPRDRDSARPELAFMSRRQRAAVLGERRPAHMRWACMRPIGVAGA